MRLKRFLAGLLSATMILGSTLTVSAAAGDFGGKDAVSADKGSVSSQGEVEGWATMDVFEVKLPAINVDQLKMLIDPQKLIKATNADRYPGSGADYSDSTLYFKNGSKYSDTTDSFTITNFSAVSVDVALTVSVTDHDGISLNSVTTDATGPSIWLGVSTNNTSATPATVTYTDSGRQVLEGGLTLPELMNKAADGAYKVKWDSPNSKYVYEVIKTDLTKFQTLSFSVKGAAISQNAAGDVIDYSKVTSVQPYLNVIWDVKAHSEEAAIDVATFTTDTKYKAFAKNSAGTAFTYTSANPNKSATVTSAKIYDKTTGAFVGNIELSSSGAFVSSSSGAVAVMITGLKAASGKTSGSYYAVIVTSSGTYYTLFTF